MVITNLSDKPLQSDWVYDDDGLDTSFIYDIRSGDGKSVAKLPAKLVSGNAHFGDLAPHKAENRAAGNIERYFDISKPGVYTIVVSQFGVKSNAITVAVKPKSDQVK
jgi:hypothetical protein